jgi:diacylglycerol O-acyltransferase-1
LLRAKTPKLVALLSAFAFSAVFHELIISIPFKRVSLHAFFGMLAQAPLIFVTRTIDRRFDNAFIGNAIFWCIFCVVGQPMGIIMYYYDIWKDSVDMNRQ